MISRTIVLNPVEPALLSVRSGLGIDLDLSLVFQRQDLHPVDPTPLFPQLALLPRSGSGVYPYDIPTDNVSQGTARVQVPGSVLIDANGYNIELYQRREALNPDDPPVAVGLIAKGVLRLDGEAYARSGPLSMINIPVVIGPPGEQGDAGQRGSIWTTGSGAPTSPDALTGDMYLDENNGDVWRFNGATWTRGNFA